jgi:RHS repeat-associated protein
LKIVDKNGVDVTSNAPVKTAYTFTNREWDQDAGMYYYRARYYDPGIGRFVQEDPDPGRMLYPITAINKYIYSGNSPINYTDPSGLSFLGDLGRVILVVAIVALAIYTGGTVAAAISTKAAALSTSLGISGAISSGLSAIGIYSTSIGVSAAVGAVAGFIGAVAAGATVGAIVGGVGNGLITQAEGGSFEEGFVTGAKAGFTIGGVSGGIGAAAKLGFSEAPGSFGSFVKSHAFSLATPALVVPFTGEFKSEFSCGSYLERCDNNEF